MDPITNLIIRACKSKNSDRRLRSVYKRFYLRNNINEDNYKWFMVDYLAEICQEYTKPRLNDIITKLDPDNIRHMKNTSYVDRAYQLLKNEIQLTSRHDFPDTFRVPAKFRKHDVQI